jgi:spermidine/putrescine transport system permease protein
MAVKAHGDIGQRQVAHAIGWLRNPWGKPRFTAVFSWLFIGWTVIPVVIAIQFSFNSARSLTTWQGFSLRWYWQDPYLSVWHNPDLRAALAQSLKLAFLTMIIATALGVGLGVALTRWRPRTADAVGGLVLLAFVLPEIVVAVAYLFVFSTVYRRVPLGTQAQLISHVTLALPVVVIVVRARLLSLGTHYEEAAMDLGASPAAVIRLVVVPLLYPAILAGGVLSFATSIDDFVSSSYLSAGQTSTTIPMYLYNTARGFPNPALNALAAILVYVMVTSAAIGLVGYRLLTRNERRRLPI